MKKVDMYTWGIPLRLNIKSLTKCFQRIECVIIFYKGYNIKLIYHIKMCTYLVNLIIGIIINIKQNFLSKKLHNLRPW